MTNNDWDVYWVSEEYRETAEKMLRDLEKSEHLLPAGVQSEGFILEHANEVKASVTPRRSRARSPWLSHWSEEPEGGYIVTPAVRTEGTQRYIASGEYEGEYEKD